MPMLTRPLTTDEVALMMGDAFKTVPMRWEALFGEPRYQMVRYRASIDRVDYKRRDTFYNIGHESPSDSVWMVPDGIGALEDKSTLR